MFLPEWLDSNMWSMRVADVWRMRVGRVITGRRQCENMDSRYVFVNSCSAKFGQYVDIKVRQNLHIAIFMIFIIFRTLDYFIMVGDGQGQVSKWGRVRPIHIANYFKPSFAHFYFCPYTLVHTRDDSISRTSYSNLLSMNNPTQLICICITVKPCIHSFVLTVGQTSASLYSLQGVFF